MNWISWILHWVYSMINKVDKLCYQLGHVTFLKSILVCKLFIALFINFLRPIFKFMTCVKVGKKCTTESTSCKSHVTPFMTLSIDSIYHGYPQYKCPTKLSCACTDVSNFKVKGVKMLLMIFWLEYKNLVKNIQVFLKT